MYFDYAQIWLIHNKINYIFKKKGKENIWFERIVINENIN